MFRRKLAANIFLFRILMTCVLPLFSLSSSTFYRQVTQGLIEISAVIVYLVVVLILSTIILSLFFCSCHM